MASDSSLLHYQSRRQLALRPENQDFVDVLGVRISPPCLEFKGAFGGETYKQKLSIQNIGKKRVVIRITSPTSFAYSLKTVRSYNLSPGLCLTREVTYTYTHQTSFSCILPIYIDGNRYDYELFAISPSSKLEVTPLVVDFGLIDAGCSSSTRDIVLRNVGDKLTRFHVDNASTDEYTIIADPVKGMLHPKHSIAVSIRLIPYKEGKLFINLWVKADEHSMLQLTGNVISAKLEPISDCLATTFTLIDFPETYIGLTNIQTIYVRNYSASAAMFTMSGEVDRVIKRLEDCREQEIDYKYCSVYPSCGTFQSGEVKAVHFKFHPTKLRRGQKIKQFYFCIFHMCRIRRKYLTIEDLNVLTYPENVSVTHTRSSCTSSGTYDQQDTDLCFTTNTFVKTPEMLKPIDDTYCIKFFVHGLVEKPTVTITPDEITLTDLSVGQKETRVLELKNSSTKLPIIFIYKKVAHIDLDQTRIFIKPFSSVQIAVYVMPHNIGTFKTQIAFDLAFYDHPRTDDGCKVIGKVIVPVEFQAKAVKKVPQAEFTTGITPTYLRETGKFCDDIRFNTPAKKPMAAVIAPHLVSKTSSALIALPNDRPRSTRPWRNNIRCKTLFTKIPRYVPPLDAEYELTVFDRKVKMAADSYYTNYTRRMASKLHPPISPQLQSSSDYHITSRPKLMCKDLKLTAPSSITQLCDHGESYTPMHLSPEAIANVVVSPLNARIGPMAAHNSCDFKINIKNKNSEAISIRVIVDKSTVVFPDGNRRLIKGNEEINLSAVYISHGIGYYTAELKLIMNECAFVAIHVFADVCPITLTLQTNNMMFSDEVTNHYLEVSNFLSTDVCFRWDLRYKNFYIAPSEAMVKSNDTFMCYVQYVPSEPGPLMADAVLVTADRNTQHLRLGVRSASKMLFFVNNNLVFKDIPLNIPVIDEVLLKNDSGVSQTYSLVSDHFDNYVQVFPSQGTVYPNSYAVIMITLRLTTCVIFNTRLKFEIGKSGFIELGLAGNVIYPEIETHPSMLHFKKIPCSTVDIIRFTICNKSNALASIRFDMSMYPEFLITRTDRDYDTEKVDLIELEKRTSIQLYVRFSPMGMCNDQFYLPMIINEILGPALNQGAGKQVAYFLTDVVPDSDVIHLPKTLFVTSVLCQATEGKINLSRTTIFLTYVPPPNICKPDYELKIYNGQSESEEFCIRLDDLIHPFYITYLRGKQPVQNEDTITCKLEPKEEIFLKISFRPDRVGHYQVLLPLFIRSDNSCTPHNHLRIKGDFPPPTITCANPVIFFKALPLMLAVQGTRRFTLMNHFENCTVELQSSLCDLEVEVQKRFPTGKNTQELWVVWQCRPLKNINENFSIRVSCSCGTVYGVLAYLVAENDFLTNYAMVYKYILTSAVNLGPRRISPPSGQRSYASVATLPNMLEKHNLTQFFASYPFYPPEKDEIYGFMEGCVATMESWVYNQGFNGKCFYKLPDSISHIPCPKRSETGTYASGKKMVCIPPFIQLLINLLGDEVTKYFELHQFSDREDEQANYVYKLYKTALAILKELGACFICIFPEYLMPFNMYKYYARNRLESCDETETMNITELPMFYKLSKQTWLDTIMQTYKVLTFPRLNQSFSNISVTSNMETPQERYRHSIENANKNNHVFNNTQLLVLYWLEFHYNEVRETYWAHNTNLKYRSLTHFCEEVSDGFIFAAVTLAYCPYLEDHFKKLCQYPSCYEEFLHNNIRVVQGWEILNFSLGITVSDLMMLHPLRSLTIACYLFEFLPCMTPSQEMKFNVPLSKKETKSFTIRNTNNFRVAYKAIIYGDEDGCFKVSAAVHVMEPKKSITIQVEYWARFAKRIKCTLILSGECKGYRYARSKVVTLVGESDVSFAVMEFEFPVELYKVTHITFNITSPYTGKAVYEVIYTYHEIHSVEDVQAAFTNVNREPFDFRQCYPLESTIEFNNKGKANVTFCALAIIDRIMPTWVIFRNQKLGDFTVYVPTMPKMPTNQEILEVVVPSNYQELVDRGKKECELFLEIPYRNGLFWKGMIDMFLLYSEDVEFWKEQLATPTGMHILQKLIRFTSQPFDLPEICARGEFIVTKETRCKINLPPKITFEQECREDFIRVPIQVPTVNVLRPFSIKLQSTGMELRQYRVIFVFSSAKSISENNT